MHWILSNCKFSLFDMNSTKIDDLLKSHLVLHSSFSFTKKKIKRERETRNLGDASIPKICIGNSRRQKSLLLKLEN